MTSHTFKEHNRVVKIVLTHEDAQVPLYANEGDAGADVRCVVNPKELLPKYIGNSVILSEKNEPLPPKAGDYVLAPGETVMFDLGFKIALRPGWEMQVRSRSGMSKRGLVVANSPGTIDSGYRGPCMVLLHNNTSDWRVIKPGTRIAQFVLKQAPQAIFEQAESLDDTQRGSGGFGSTGTK